MRWVISQRGSDVLADFEALNTMTELQKRIVTGVLLIAFAVALLWMGGNGFWVIIATGGILMMGEWAGLVSAAGQARLGQYAICIPIAIMAPMAAGPGLLSFGFLLGAALFLTMVCKNFRMGWGVLWIGVPMMALIWLREGHDGLLLAGWALSLVWATDIGAYIAGRSIGGPKIAPSISPNKTWAGLFGGMAGALALGWGLHIWAGLPVALALSGPGLAICAQAGDFYESWMKRVAGVKDSGSILPGHGGALDRLDGALSSVPIAALLVYVLVPAPLGSAVQPAGDAQSVAMIPACMTGPDARLLPNDELREKCGMPVE
jgi:phosphatidate cytidylyltransferase